MKIFVTGATGFIGTPLVAELAAAGHQVRGMARSDAGAEQLKQAGIEVHRGDITNVDSLRAGATGMDAVIHLAFNHDDMSKFAESGKAEQQAIQALGSALGAGGRLVVTSGTGLAQGGPGHVRTEQDAAQEGLPRNPEAAARAIAAETGLQASVVRLPQVHDTRKQGLVTWLIQTAREKGVSAYVGDGSNRWAAAPRADVAHLYRLVVERTAPGVNIYHAVQEEGVALREIAEAIGRGLGVPTRSITAEEAATHFGWLGHFAGTDMPASSILTQQAMGWKPTGPGLIEDLQKMDYAQQ